MTSGQQQLSRWGYRMADMTIGRIRGLRDDVRADALRLALEEIRPGLNRVVRQRTAALRREGHSYPQALRIALAEQYAQLPASLAGPKGLQGLGDPPADADTPSTPAAREPTPAERTISAVGGMISAAITGAIGIAGAVTTTRRERADAAFGREQWRREQSAAELRGEREFALEERRLAAGISDADRAALEAERERELDARLDLLGPPVGGTSIGTVMIVGGLLVVVGVGGYMLYKKWKKRREEAG
jgi:hypothetical protein